MDRYYQSKAAEQSKKQKSNPVAINAGALSKEMHAYSISLVPKTPTENNLLSVPNADFNS